MTLKAVSLLYCRPPPCSSTGAVDLVQGTVSPCMPAAVKLASAYLELLSEGARPIRAILGCKVLMLAACLW
jgi:hypothetical protein